MNIKKQDQKSWLSTTSLVLSIVWAVLSLTIIGAILWIPLTIAGLIFGIIALVKKQKKWMAVAGIIISGLVILFSIIILTVWIMFFRKNSDVLMDPIKDFSQMIDENPELAELMQNPEFANEFEYEFKNIMTEKFGEEPEIENREEMKWYIPTIFEEMEWLMLELKDKHKN
jgi:ABC-type dipeptide/oligopeptide/nickel transport system permease component